MEQREEGRAEGAGLAGREGGTDAAGACGAGCALLRERSERWHGFGGLAHTVNHSALKAHTGELRGAA